MVIGGDHDVILPGLTMKIFENKPKAYLWILPNSGHSNLVAYIDEFNKNVNEKFRQGLSQPLPLLDFFLQDVNELLYFRVSLCCQAKLVIVKGEVKHYGGDTIYKNATFYDICLKRTFFKFT